MRDLSKLFYTTVNHIVVIGTTLLNWSVHQMIFLKAHTRLILQKSLLSH